MNNKLYIGFLLFTFTIIGSSLEQVFTIKKQIVGSQRTQMLGKLTILVQPQYDEFVAHIQPFISVFISSEDFQQSNTIVLQFASEKSNGQTYRSAVTKNIFQNKPNLIQTILVYPSQDLNVTAISYAQTRKLPGEQNIKVSIIRNEKGRQEIFKIVPMQQTQKVQEESFFSKYKWPIIIGIVLMYFMSSMDPNQAQRGAQGGQGGQQAR